MKPNEAARIPALLAARRQPVAFEETIIEGIRMLVILGKEVDTVIQYTQNGGAKMPQLSGYKEVAESAAIADQKLAKQRASGHANATGEGIDWPRDWKLADARAAGKIWYQTASPIRPPRGRAVKPNASAKGNPWNFALQFAPSEIPTLVRRRRTNVDEEKASQAGRRIAVGDYSRSNLEVIVAWKNEGRWLDRVMSFLDRNTDESIAHALQAAITNDERAAIEALCRLKGIRIPTASAVMTEIMPDKYTIIDVNALKSLGVPDQLKDNVDYYLDYLRMCRDLAHKYAVSLREIDHALWQWGHDH